MKKELDFLNNNILNNTSAVIACSGGPDSMCLLYLLNSLKIEKNLQLICAHVNHKIRQESEKEAQMVQKYCKENGIIFELLEINEYKKERFSEEDARKKRYIFFNEVITKYHAKYLLTAHHGDDLIETILMRITRGSNLSGYVGIKQINDNGSYILLRPLLTTNKENILSLLQNSNQDNIKYSLQNLGNNLEICNIFISFDKILIKPFLPPTFKNLHYYNAKQRIFLSATMGVSGEIERLTGQNNIKYIRCDETAINGLRFFILPHQLDDPKNFFLEYIKNSKTLLIVNSNKIRDIFIKFFEKELPELSVLTNDDLEKANDSIIPFLDSDKNTILILPNRFYGIDLPEDKCRRIIMYNLPLYSNLQEKFFWNALGAISRFKEKIGIRIVQAVGRCTRKKNDFASILLFDKELIDWLQDIRNSETLPSQLQIELDIANSNTLTDSKNLLAKLGTFENETESRQLLNKYISENITTYSRKDDDINTILAKCASKEIIYLQRLWGKDYSNAYQKAIEIINILREKPYCLPYKAFWNYIASSIAYLANKNNDSSLDWCAIYSRHINDAINMTPTVNWLNNAKQGLKIQQNDYPDLTLILNTLQELKFKSGKFTNKIEELKEKVNSDKAKLFSKTLTIMGRLLGFHSYDWEDDNSLGTPDCVWCGTTQGLSFEAKTMTEREDKPISCNYVGQMARQQQWAKSTLKLQIPLTSVMITKQNSMQKDALKSINEKDRFIKPNIIRELFAIIVEMYIDLSQKTINLSVEETRDMIYQELVNKKLLLPDIIQKLQKFDTLTIIQ